MASTALWIANMSPNDKPFYQTLGKRIAERRKAKGLTQQQLAEILGISQKTIAHYEVGRLRVAVIMLPILCKALSVTLDDLVGTPAAKQKSKRGPASVLQQQIEQIRELPRAKQKFVIDMLNTVIQQQAS